MFRIVVFEDMFRCSTVSYPLDHTGMVPRITEYFTPRQLGGQREEGRVVGHVAGGEDQCRVFLVEGGDLGLQVLMEHGVAGDVPGSASSNTMIADCLMNCSNHLRVG